jgi:hypothetical protein
VEKRAELFERSEFSARRWISTARGGQQRRGLSELGPGPDPGEHDADC